MKTSDIFFEKANEGNGQLLLLGGRPGMGKTTIAIELAHDAVLKNMKVGYYSLDMIREGINKRVSEMGYHLTVTSFVINDNPYITVSEIAEECKANHYDLVIIDFFLLLFLRKDKNREVFRREINQLRELVNDESCTVLVLSGLPSAIEYRCGNHKPTLEDIPLLGLDAEWFDQVFLLYRENYYHEKDGSPDFTIVMKDKEVVFKWEKHFGWADYRHFDLGQTCAFTGHRPEKLNASEKDTRAWLREQIRKAIEDGFTMFISGMQRGVDLWAAYEVIAWRNAEWIKNGKSDVKLILAIPFPKMFEKWSKKWKDLYSYAFGRRDGYIVLDHEPGRKAFVARDRWMVDHAARVIAVYTGTPGGTKKAIEYAKELGREIITYDSTAEEGGTLD